MSESPPSRLSGNVVVEQRAALFELIIGVGLFFVLLVFNAVHLVVRSKRRINRVTRPIGSRLDASYVARCTKPTDPRRVALSATLDLLQFRPTGPPPRPSREVPPALRDGCDSRAEAQALLHWVRQAAPAPLRHASMRELLAYAGPGVLAPADAERFLAVYDAAQLGDATAVSQNDVDFMSRQLYAIRRELVV